MSVYIGKNIIRVDEVESTNMLAKNILKLDESVPNGTVVVCKYQTSGKGCGENTWESQYGMNLTFSIILYPSFIPPDEQFSISQSVSLGICDYLKTLTRNVSIKWPNDIYIGDRKVAGILIENSICGNTISNSVVGIGLNVNQVVFRGSAPNPTSMKLRLARDFDLEEVLSMLVVFIENRLLQLETDYGYDISKDYKASLYRLNQFHRFVDDSGEFEAKIIGVADNGCLLLQFESGDVSSYRFKEVAFVI